MLLKDPSLRSGCSDKTHPCSETYELTNEGSELSPTDPVVTRRHEAQAGLAGVTEEPASMFNSSIAVFFIPLLWYDLSCKNYLSSSGKEESRQ